MAGESETIVSGDRSVTLTYAAVSSELLANIGYAYGLQITVTDATLLPAEIFVHQRRILDPLVNQEPTDELVNVASPLDIATFPVADPFDDLFPQFFRLPAVTMYYHSLKDLAEAKDAIRWAVQGLLNDYNRIDEVYDIETKVIGTAARQLTLHREQCETSQFTGQTRLRVTATEHTNLVTHVFGHLRREMDAAEGLSVDEFAFMASRDDIFSYPPTVPDASITPAFFRKDVIDVITPTLADAEAVWTQVTESVQNLIDAYDQYDTLSVASSEIL